MFSKSKNFPLSIGSVGLAHHTLDMPWLGQISLTTFIAVYQRHKHSNTYRGINKSPAEQIFHIWSKDCGAERRFELPRDGPRFPVARTTRLCDLGAISPTGISCLTETVENRLWQLRIDYITTVGGRPRHHGLVV